MPAAASTVAAALLAVAALQPNDVYVELNPSTVEAGGQVGIRASCPDNSRAAMVRSDVFGRITAEPDGGLLTATAKVPEEQEPRSFTVRLTCPDGETATATLHVVGRTRPSRGPATGLGGTAAGDHGGLLVGAGLLTVAGGLALGVVALRGRRRWPAGR